jgi:hypothetical protein
MATNVNSAFGLSPVRHLNGSPYNAQGLKCYIPSTDGTAMYIGDPVDLAGSSDTSGQCPTVSTLGGAAGYPIFGVITSFEPDPDNLTLTYRKASTNRYCYVAVAVPDLIFEVQAGATALANTTVGLNAVMKSGSGSTVTGLSGWYMDSGDSTAPAADATYQLLIINCLSKPFNDVTLAYAKWEVIVSLSRLNSIYDAHASAQYGAKGV